MSFGRKVGCIPLHVPNEEKIKVPTHLIFICRDSYLISASFITSQATQAVSIVWMSRPQNYTVMSTCLAPKWTCVEVSKSPHFAWNRGTNLFLLYSTTDSLGTSARRRMARHFTSSRFLARWRFVYAVGGHSRNQLRALYTHKACCDYATTDIGHLSWALRGKLEIYYEFGRFRCYVMSPKRVPKIDLTS